MGYCLHIILILVVKLIQKCTKTMYFLGYLLLMKFYFHASVGDVANCQTSYHVIYFETFIFAAGSVVVTILRRLMFIIVL